MHACVRCGYPFKETDTFCTVCGVPLPKIKTETAETAPADAPIRPVWETAKASNPNDLTDDLPDEKQKGSSAKTPQAVPGVVYKTLEEDLLKRAVHETDALKNEILTNRTKILAGILLLALLILAVVLFRSCTMQLFHSVTSGATNTASSLYGPIG